MPFCSIRLRNEFSRTENIFSKFRPTDRRRNKISQLRVRNYLIAAILHSTEIFELQRIFNCAISILIVETYFFRLLPPITLFIEISITFLISLSEEVHDCYAITKFHFHCVKVNCNRKLRFESINLDVVVIINVIIAQKINRTLSVSFSLMPDAREAFYDSLLKITTKRRVI